MKKYALILTITALVASSALIYAQSAPQPRRGSAERSLIGVNLYDTGARVISLYGSPDEIQGLNVGDSAQVGGGADGGGRGGPRGGGGGAGAGPQEGIEANNPLSDLVVGNPFGSGSEWQRQLGPTAGAGTTGPGQQGRAPGGPPRIPGGPPGVGPEGAAGPGLPTANQGSRVIFTRWIYRRNNSRYAFVFDKFNRVIQIEAIGMSNNRVRTRRGVTFGSSFGTLIQRYGAPDGYEVNGDNLVVRFLVNDRVAFRLSRLRADRPHVVTGIVVAAGKT